MTHTTASDHTEQFEARWRQVLERDKRADHEFVFAVRTTGIYCRPSCPARRPKRENVAFYTDALAAEAAGFRTCKRCLPRQAITPGDQAIAGVCRALQQAVISAERPPTAEQLAVVVKLSASRLHTLFKAAVGMTINQYTQALRSAQVRAALDKGASITDAIFAAGYSSTGHFYRRAERELGMPARRYQNKGQAMTIEYTIATCELGQLLVARSERGICAIALGDSGDELIADLLERFSNAQKIMPSDDFAEQIQQVISHIEQPGAASLNLPLDVRGTAFQRRVWQALQNIKPGQTISYRELAEQIGAPTAARAVANACGANTLAVLVPCHRVVRGDGSLSGYRWGVERKRELLKREKMK
jgi:AraC family transcriptional regulator of adaptative response/methylated-DNA-[protein]-cysteine methyltransferase